MVTYQSEAIYQVLPDILPLLDMNHAEAQKALMNLDHGAFPEAHPKK